MYKSLPYNIHTTRSAGDIFIYERHSYHRLPKLKIRKGQFVYIENCMGKSPLMKKKCVINYLIWNKVFLPQMCGLLVSCADFKVIPTLFSENRKMCRVRVHCDVWICINLHISFIVTYLTEWFFYNFIMTHWWRGVKSNRDKKPKVLWIMSGHRRLRINQPFTR